MAPMMVAHTSEQVKAEEQQYGQRRAQTAKDQVDQEERLPETLPETPSGAIDQLIVAEFPGRAPAAGRQTRPANRLVRR